MLSNSDSTIIDPYFSRSSKSGFSYPASRSFVCRFVRVGLCVPIRISVIRLSICMSVCLTVRRVSYRFLVNIRVGLVCRN